MAESDRFSFNVGGDIPGLGSVNFGSDGSGGVGVDVQLGGAGSANPGTASFGAPGAPGVRYTSNPRALGFTLVSRHKPTGGLWRNDNQVPLTISDGVAQLRVVQGGMIDQLPSGQLLPQNGASFITGPSGQFGQPANQPGPAGQPPAPPVPSAAEAQAAAERANGIGAQQPANPGAVAANAPAAIPAGFDSPIMLLLLLALLGGGGGSGGGGGKKKGKGKK